MASGLVRGARGRARRAPDALAPALADLVAAAGRLPLPEPTDEDLPEIPRNGAELVTAIGRTLGEWDRYWTTMQVYGDDDEDNQALTWYVSQDLEEVYYDVKPGLVALSRGFPEDDVTFDWRILFYSHWGRHATDALRALHARLADESIGHGPYP